MWYIAISRGEGGVEREYVRMGYSGQLPHFWCPHGVFARHVIGSH
jgi:hypothetical protein